MDRRNNHQIIHPAIQARVVFLDDKEGNQFTAIVSRPDLSTNSISFIAKSDDKSQGTVEKSREKSREKIMEKESGDFFDS